MSLRPSCLITVMLIASLLSAAVGHACSNLSAMKAVAQTPCDHHQPQDEPLNKTDKDNCDSIRYGMLSTQSTRFQKAILQYYPVLLDLGLVLSTPPSRSLFPLSRSQSPFSIGPGASRWLSHIVLRI